MKRLREVCSYHPPILLFSVMIILMLNPSLCYTTTAFNASLSLATTDVHHRRLAHEDHAAFMRATAASADFLKEQEQLKTVNGKPEVTIVIYDKIKGYLNWQLDWFVKAAKTQCPTTTCILEEKLPAEIRGTQLQVCDVVLFHAPTHGQDGPTFPLKRSPTALYLLLSMEQPQYARMLKNPKALEDDFDMLATYSLSSIYPGTSLPNIPLTYYPLNIMHTSAIMQPPRPFQEKTGYGSGITVAVFASNCKAAGAHERLAYISELMNYIKVHSYGGCLNNIKEPDMPVDSRWPAMAQRRARKIKVLSHYKFYLAFENLPVVDYVSEKVFEGLFAGTVPVYRGSPTIHKFMPSNDSYIDASHMSAKDLAALLTDIGNDEKKYNRYLSFKQRPLPQSFEDIALMSYTHPNVLCRICDFALKVRQKRLELQLKERESQKT